MLGIRRKIRKKRFKQVIGKIRAEYRINATQHQLVEYSFERIILPWHQQIEPSIKNIVSENRKKKYTKNPIGRNGIDRIGLQLIDVPGS